MGISLRPQHLKRYRDIALLLNRYGRSDLVKQVGLDEALDRDAKPAETPPEALALAADLERLGPTYIKLGQLLSTRPDILPATYLDALTRLQDNVEPFSYAEVEEIVTAELGVRISKAFAEFDAVPVAAASLGQVHRAKLRDGRAVVVKVQRPGIREQITEDLDALGEIAEFVDSHIKAGAQYDFQGMLEEFRRSVTRELDYRLEAQNLATLAENLAEFSLITVPTPVLDYTTSKVLTMDHVSGQKVTRLSPLTRLEIDGKALAHQLFEAYLKQILVDGFFHADPHPGNVFLTEDGRVALLDLGMVARISPRLQEDLLQLLLAVAEGRSDDAITFAIRIGEKTPEFDQRLFALRVTDLVAQQQGVAVKQIEVGRIVLEISQVAGQTGMRLPVALTMLAKTLLNLDQVGWTLDPDFDPNSAIRAAAGEILRQRLQKSASPGNILSSILELRDLAQTLPRRLNKILEAVANNELEIKVHTIDEDKLMSGFKRIANRITLGLILSALIIGAAMLIQVQTTFRILGYPGLAMILFLIAAAGGLALAITILRDD